MASKPSTNVVTTTPVVVFRAENRTSLAIVRTLGRLGVKVFCVDHEPDALAMKSRYCAGRFKWDFESNSPDDSAQFLVDVARKIGQKAILLPTFDTRNLFVDRYRDLLSKSFLLPQPQPGAVPRLYSKQSMYELCKSTGVPTPEAIFPSSVEQAVNEGPNLRFPLVVKGIDGDRLNLLKGRSLAIVRQQSDLREVYNALDEPGISNLALQEFIPANAQDAWILSGYFDTSGNCRFMITGQKLRQLPIHGGITTLGVCAPCEPIVDSISRIAKAAGYQGIIDADFLYDKRDGLWKLLDVNPRPGANFRLLVDKHGFDVVRAMYLDLTGQNLPAVEPVWGRRWLVEDRDLVALREHIREGSLTLGAWFRSLRGVSELAYFAVDDLRPSAVFAIRLAANLVRGAVRRLRPPTKHGS
jgi:predicted ATP-grasp superfamily ATP-dependent carboligase